MRIAIVHPYPVHGRGVGGVTRVHALVRYLAPSHQVTVLAHASPDPREDAVAVRDLAGLGVRQLLFPLPRPRLARKLRWAAGHAPYCVGRNRNPALEEALRQLDEETGLDVVHVEFSYLEPLLGGAGPRAVRVLAEQETLSLSLDRLRRARPRSLYERYSELERGKIRRFERAVLPRFDLLYGISPVEAERMASAAERPVAVLPHIVCTDAFTPPETEPEGPSVLFVGNFGHRPNLHALVWLLERIWPAVAAAVPAARLDVAGPGADAGARRLEGPGVRFLGRVEDLAARYRAAAVFVNPIRTGGGMRGKVLEAFACGRAVVSTRLGMEGIDAVPGAHHLEAEEPEDFARTIVACLRGQETRRALGRAARELVERRYRPAVVFAALAAGYEEAAAARRATGGARL